jgi:hypothetical protein
VSETRTVRLHPERLAEQATARAGQLIEVTLAHSECEATDDERRLVKLGVDLGVAAYVTALKAQATEGDHVA